MHTLLVATYTLTIGDELPYGAIKKFNHRSNHIHLLLHSHSWDTHW
ncbi:TPA: hypothetical protein QCP80_003312 [Bacillus cereus]|nr:hypothetical protein [Bacillus cereus]